MSQVNYEVPHPSELDLGQTRELNQIGLVCDAVVEGLWDVEF